MQIYFNYGGNHSIHSNQQPAASHWQVNFKVTLSTNNSNLHLCHSIGAGSHFPISLNVVRFFNVAFLIHFHVSYGGLVTFNSNMTSFFHFVNKRAIYRLGIISLEHAPVHVTDFPVANVHVDELSSARIWQHTFCATLSANVNINYRLPIKVYYRICTLRHIRIEINHGSQNVLWVSTWVGGY